MESTAPEHESRADESTPTVSTSCEPSAMSVAASAASPQAAAPSVEIKVPEFVPLENIKVQEGAVPMDRFYDVHVSVWAELGRITLPIGDLLQLSEGSVLQLRRPVTEPVDLVAQGVRLARGEVVVVDDCFAVRIKEIEHSSQR